MIQGRSPSQRQVVQVQVSTWWGRSSRGTQAGEGGVSKALLLPQLLLQVTDLPQVRLHQSPLWGRQGRAVCTMPGSSCRLPKPKTSHIWATTAPHTGAEGPRSHAPRLSVAMGAKLLCHCKQILLAIAGARSGLTTEGRPGERPARNPGMTTPAGVP